MMNEEDLVFIQPQETYVSGSTTPLPDTELKTSNIIALTATEEYSRSEKASATSFPVGDRTDRADHEFTNETSTIRFSGVVAEDSIGRLTTLDIATTPQQYIERIRKIMIKKRLVTIYMPDGMTAANCIITDFTPSRNKEVSDGFRVNISAKQLILVEDEVTVIPYSSVVAKKVSKGVVPSSQASENYLKK